MTDSPLPALTEARARLASLCDQWEIARDQPDPDFGPDSLAAESWRLNRVELPAAIREEDDYIRFLETAVI
jgi:hypothetical protein